MNFKPLRFVERIVVHCSATRSDADIGVREIDQWHRAKGWLKVGYHFVIRRDGTVEKGREENEVGAHAAGFNSTSIGICMIGGLGANGRGEDNFTSEQYVALLTLCRRLTNEHANAKLVGHRDLSPDLNGDGRITANEFMKDCPSFDVRSWAKESGLTE